MISMKTLDARTRSAAIYVVALLLLVLSGMIVDAARAGTPAAGDEAASAGNVYAPSIISDKDDYRPGELVTLTGSNWQPGEKVHIYVNDESSRSWDRNADVVADEAGELVYTFNLPDWFVADYSVKATGESGAVATTTFTDGNIGVTSSPVATGANQVIFKMKYTVHTAANPNSNDNCTSNGLDSQTTEVDVGSTTTGSGKNAWTLGVDQKNSVRLEAAAAANQPAGWTFKEWTGPTGSFFVIDPSNPRVICVTGNFTGSRDFRAVYQQKTATALAAAAASGTYGGTTTLAATLTAGGSGVGGKTVSFELNGNAVCGGASRPACPTTNSSGVASLSGVSLAGIAAGTHTGAVRAAFAEDATHLGSTGTNTLTVDKAAQAISFGALPAKTFGDAPFTVSATGGASSNPVTFSASGNCTSGGTNGSVITITGAGPCTVTASQAGNQNYLPAQDVSRSVTVGKAATTTTITCEDGPFTFDGSAKTPCTAAVTGAGGLDQRVSVSYEDNTNAGRATASAAYAETGNHLASSDSKTFTIAKAPTTTTVTCGAGPFTYDGSAKTPCSAGVTGPAGLDRPVTVAYADNTNAGEATASAAYAETGNYLASGDSKTFTIGKAPTTAAVSCPASVTHTGSAIEPCSAIVTGAGGLNEAVTIIYTNNVDVGTATANATYAESRNHKSSTDSKTFNITTACRSAGTFQAPIKDGVRNIVKHGNVVPVKLRFADCNGNALGDRTLSIRLVAGVVNGEDVADGAETIPTSTSAADTTGIMRFLDSHHMYNLTTKGLTAGSAYTIVIRDTTSASWNSAPTVGTAVIEPKK